MRIKFYGATWCRDCMAPKAFLDENKIAYEYINVDEVEAAAEEVTKINQGLQSLPTIIFPNGKILVEPNIEDFKQALEENNLLQK